MFPNGIDRSRIDLVATLPPEGMIIHTKLGITKDPLRIPIPFDVDKINPRYLCGSDVGLEWREDGKKMPVSDKWAQESFVLVSDKRDIVQTLLQTQ